MLYEIVYYSDRVAAEVENWPTGIRADYLLTIERMVSEGANVGMPRTKALGQGLFEIRAHGDEGIGRAFFCTLVGQRIVILHTFIKKTQATPQRDMDKARKRLKEVKSK
jgi:phage-related protein